MKKNLVNKFYNEGYPTILEVHPTFKCNLKCLFCGGDKTKPDRISNRGWFKIFEEAFNSPIKHIRVVGGGEPLMRKNLFADVLQKLSKRKNQTIMLNTNFTLADKRLLEMFVEFGWDEILISIEGIGSLHDKLVGIKSAFKKLSDNLKYLQLLKKQKNSISPRITFHTVLNKLNYMHLTKLILFAKRYNVDYVNLNLIRIFPTIEKLGLNEDDMKKFQNVLIHKYIPLLSKFEIPNNYSSLNVSEDKNNRQINQNVDCLLPWFYMLISADGSVYPCCKFVGSNKEMDFHKSIKESWKNSGSLKRLRESYLKEKIPRLCSLSCRSSYKKMWLEQANNFLGNK